MCPALRVRSRSAAAVGLQVANVLVDNRDGARNAVRHLLDQGHRRIGYLGDKERIWTIQERCAGFHDAFADAGIEPDPELVRHGPRNRAAAAALTTALLKLPDPPTALFTLSDKLTPPVTVVAQDASVLGATAALLLFARISGDTTPARDVIPRTRLVTPRLRRDPAAGMSWTGSTASNG
jgi:DNA-binding LacI/PurR family transcriptional regulator